MRDVTSAFCVQILMRCLQTVTRKKSHVRARSVHCHCNHTACSLCTGSVHHCKTKQSSLLCPCGSPTLHHLRQRTVRSLLLPMSMMVMLGLACCRASSSQLARWLKVSRLGSSAEQMI